ncbi:MAG: hypothetical protein D6798_05480, partial [Deltaproteobacteria bacterium]
MASPYAPLDVAASRWTRALARGLHWVRSAPGHPEATAEWFRLATALVFLGLPPEALARAREGDALEELAARVEVLH